MPSRIFVAVLAMVFVGIFGILCQGEKEFVVEYFPAEVGNWWEHEYRFLIVVFDTVANDTSENLFVDSLHDEIVGINTVAGWSCYRFHETTYDNTRWYAHPDSALLFVASLINSDTGFVIPSSGNRELGLHGMTFGTTNDVASYIRNLTLGLDWNLDADTAYLTPPHKSYVYPMRVGTSWIRMIEPWYEEGEVVSAESVTVPAGTFYTLRLRIERDMGMEDERYMWISEEGMIRDSMYARGAAINSIGDTVGYFDVYTIYDLLSLNVE